MEDCKGGGISISRNVLEQSPGLLIRVIVVTGVMRVGVFAAVLAIVSTRVSLLSSLLCIARLQDRLWLSLWWLVVRISTV